MAGIDGSMLVSAGSSIGQTIGGGIAGLEQTSAVA